MDQNRELTAGQPPVWYWTERWQRMEREVDEHVRRGQTTVFDTTDEFLARLEDSEGDR